MKRDMNKIIDGVKVPSAYDMTYTETCELLDMALTGESELIFEAISKAFKYGYALGCRAEKNRAAVTTKSVSTYIDIKEYAQRHDLDASTVRKKILKGNFPEAVLMGNSYLIPEDAPWIDLRYKANKVKE